MVGEAPPARSNPDVLFALLLILVLIGATLYGAIRLALVHEREVAEEHAENYLDLDIHRWTDIATGCEYLVYGNTITPRKKGRCFE